MPQLSRLERVSMDTQSRDDLLKMYGIIGETYGSEEAGILASIPGWSKKLEEFEDAFTAAFQAGRECRHEFEELREHWRSGIRLTKQVQGAENGGNGQ